MMICTEALFAITDVLNTTVDAREDPGNLEYKEKKDPNHLMVDQDHGEAELDAVWREIPHGDTEDGT